MNESNQLVETPYMVAPLSAVAIRAQVNLIQEVMKEVMQVDQHYGVIPGCGKKPTLLKPGAEKLAMTFRLRPIMDNGGDIRVDHMDNGHREITVHCHIYNMSGLELATGVGSCSTMESKYRYRNSSDYEITGQPIPKDSKEKKAEYRKQGFGMKNIDGVWEWVKYKADEKSDNPDIADTYNTVLKMAKKRAFVDGILSATGASDIFTQDIEDISHEETGPAKNAATSEQHISPQRKSAAQPASAAVIKEYAGMVDRKYSPKGKSKYFSYTLAEHSGVYFQISDEAMMETLARHKSEGNNITLKVEETVNGEYTNRLITEIIVNVPETAAAGAEGGTTEEGPGY